MQNPVLIKGNKYGIRLVLDKDMEFAALLDMVMTKFTEAKKFFNSSVNLGLTVEGRELSNEELDTLISGIRENAGLDIAYVVDGEAVDSHSEYTVKRVEEQENPPEPDPKAPRMIYENKETVLQNDSMFYKGTLRSGQAIESQGSIVVLGDVNPGATVISAGNVIVIGRLLGMVHAGATGNQNAFVLALSMNPMQIRIADAIARSADKPKRKVDDDAKIAFLEDGNIYIEPIKKSVLNDIHI